MNNKFTWPTKIIALSFIGMVLVMNVWLHHYLFGGEVPHWAHLAIEICVAGTLVGGLGQVGLWIRKRFSDHHDDE